MKGFLLNHHDILGSIRSFDAYQTALICDINLDGLNDNLLYLVPYLVPERISEKVWVLRATGSLREIHYSTSIEKLGLKHDKEGIIIEAKSVYEWFCRKFGEIESTLKQNCKDFLRVSLATGKIQ